MNMGFFDVLKRLDAYPRTLEDFSVRTISGAAGKYNNQYRCVSHNKQRVLDNKFAYLTKRLIGLLILGKI